MSDLKVRPPKDRRKNPYAKPACGAPGKTGVWGTQPSAGECGAIPNCLLDRADCGIASFNSLKGMRWTL